MPNTTPVVKAESYTFDPFDRSPMEQRCETRPVTIPDHEQIMRDRQSLGRLARVNRYGR